MGTLRDETEPFDRSLTAIARSEGTRQSYREGLLQFAAWAHDPTVEDITRARVDDWVIHLRGLRRADGTIAGRRAALRVFLKWAAAEGGRAKARKHRRFRELGPPGRSGSSVSGSL